MGAISTTVKFDRMVALSDLTEWWFSDVDVTLTPVIEHGTERRWPDPPDPILMSYRAPDKLNWFQLEFPRQVARDLYELCEHPDNNTHRLVELDGWTQRFVDVPSSWGWKPPFYTPAYHGPDPKWPWIHWFFTIQWDGTGFRSVPVDRTVTVDEREPITSHSGFFYTKQGPG